MSYLFVRPKLLFSKTYKQEEFYERLGFVLLMSDYLVLPPWIFVLQLVAKCKTVLEDKRPTLPN